MNKKKIMVVCAHPDDEVLGCGGTIRRLANEGNEIYTVILGEGVAARFDDKNDQKKRREILSLKKNIVQANKCLGAKKIFTFNFPDNRFDTVALLDIVKAIEKVKKEVKPEIIFTHYSEDLNIDHQITFNAVITASRPVPSETVKEIYSFETLSSTEWKYPLSFSPDVYFNIAKTIADKLKAMKAYKAEMRKYPHTRSLEFIKVNANYWGARIGCRNAEAFKAVRIIK